MFERQNILLNGRTPNSDLPEQQLEIDVNEFMQMQSSLNSYLLGLLTDNLKVEGVSANKAQTVLSGSTHTEDVEKTSLTL